MTIYFVLIPALALVACTGSYPRVQQAARGSSSAEALADCPRWPGAPAADDLSDMAGAIELEDRDLAADRARCAPARAECLRSCASYVERCPGPYFSEDSCFRVDPIPAHLFCASACSGMRQPYLSRANEFREQACPRAATR